MAGQKKEIVFWDERQFQWFLTGVAFGSFFATLFLIKK
jgi:hypothetical protein